MRNACVLSGSSHPDLTANICKTLSIPVGKSILTKFSNNETNVMIGETVRGIDCYIIQSGCGNVNDNLIQLLIMISACKTASARKITAVIPCFPYARQSENQYRREPTPNEQNKPKKAKRPSDENYAETAETNSPIEYSHKRISSISITQSNANVKELSAPVFDQDRSAGGYKHWNARPGVLICEMLEAAGCDHIITMDLHDPQFQGYFTIPVDNLLSAPLTIKYIRERIEGYRDAVIVSPDAGGAKRAAHIADKLNMDFALIHKERHHRGPHGNEGMLVGHVQDKVAIIIDDMADTSETICSAADLLTERGATKIYAMVTHGILSGDSIDRIERSTLTNLIVSNTVPQGENLKLGSKIKVMDISPTFAEAIRRIHNGESVSLLRDDVPY